MSFIHDKESAKDKIIKKSKFYKRFDDLIAEYVC